MSLIFVLGLVCSASVQAKMCEKGETCYHPKQTQKNQVVKPQSQNAHKPMAQQTPSSNKPKAKPHSVKPRQAGWYFVTAKRLNLRIKPSHGAPIQGHLRHSDRVRVNRFVNGWAEISFHGHRYWVSAIYIRHVTH